MSGGVDQSISYVSTQRSQNTDEINTDLDLNSSVELNFRTNYLPLNRMAAQAQADRIRKATLNPSAETADAAAATARENRLKAQMGAERERRMDVKSALDASGRAPQGPEPPGAPTVQAPTAAAVSGKDTKAAPVAAPLPAAVETKAGTTQPAPAPLKDAAPAPSKTGDAGAAAPKPAG